MPTIIKALLVEDSEKDTELILRGIRRGGYEVEVERVTTPMGMSNALMQKDWDIVISEYCTSHLSGYDALKLFKRAGLDCPFIIVSGTPRDESAIAIVKAGADDYVTKDSLEWLVPAIERGLKQTEVCRQWDRAKEKLQHIAYHDVTTDLPNYAFLHERLDYAISDLKRDKGQVALIAMKVNRFRVMNGTLGDQLFDLLLIIFARTVRAALDQSLTFACLRSNEFAVVVPVTSSTDYAVQIVYKIIKALESPLVIGEGLKVQIQTSFGIALFPEHANASDLLLQRARAALGTAIMNRRQYSFYSGEQYEGTQRQLSLASELRRAIVENQLFLLYQPMLDLSSFQVTGVEALVRWKHPRLGVLNSDHFIPLAEQTGLIMPLTLWVLNEALRQCGVWNKESQHLKMAVNLSPWNLQSSVLADQIRGLLCSAGVSAPHLELEITENAIMSNPTQAMESLTAIKQIGLRLAVDDFGSGYSSLAHLQRLPLDAIKIDRSFVTKLATEARDAVIVRSTIHLAHNLGLKVVAEGVENRESLRMLVTMGCDMAQGYYIGDPRTAEQFLNGFGIGSHLKGKTLSAYPC